MTHKHKIKGYIKYSARSIKDRRKFKINETFNLTPTDKGFHVINTLLFIENFWKMYDLFCNSTDDIIGSDE